MKRLGFWLVLLVPGLLHAQQALETSAQQKFISGGTIRLHLEAGGYTITLADSENIVVTCRAHTSFRRGVYEASRFLACLASSWLAPRSAGSRDFGTAEVHFWRHDSLAPGSRRIVPPEMNF